MKSGSNSWFRQKPPRDEAIEDVWGDLFNIACDEIIRWLPDNAILVSYLSNRTANDLHACITTLAAQKEEEEEYISTADEMPSFYAQAADDEEESHSAPDAGGIIMHDMEIEFDERSELRLEMAIRSIERRIVTAGLIDHRYRSVEVPHNLGMKIVGQLRKNYRRTLADILLYQLAEQVAQSDLDEEFEDPGNLAAIIHNHLDLPNIREFHRLIAGV